MKAYGRLVLLITASLLLSGCNSTSVDTDEQGNTTNPAVFITTESGGCVRIGPNCARHTLYNDGTVTVSRASIGLIEARGQIDTGQVESLLIEIRTTDFAALQARLPPGRCSGCVDGVDHEYQIASATGPVVLSSIDYSFDPAEPLFALANGTFEAMQNAAVLEVQSRN